MDTEENLQYYLLKEGQPFEKHEILSGKDIIDNFGIVDSVRDAIEVRSEVLGTLQTFLRKGVYILIKTGERFDWIEPNYAFERLFNSQCIDFKIMMKSRKFSTLLTEKELPVNVLDMEKELKKFLGEDIYIPLNSKYEFSDNPIDRVSIIARSYKKSDYIFDIISYKI